MSSDYLIKEYELCFEQLRYYDTRHGSILRYLFTLTSSVATAQFAVYKFLNGPTQGFFACQAFLSTIVFIATLILYLAMIQNRVYFVYIARQINAIRGHFMRDEPSGFTNNQLYTSTNFSALKPSSVHTFQLLGAALISSLFGGLSAYSVYPAIGSTHSLPTAITVFCLVAAVEVVGGVIYLIQAGKKTADDAIHGDGK